MTAWLHDIDQRLTPPEQALVDGLDHLLTELHLAALDQNACSATKDDVGLHIVLAHRTFGPIVEVDHMGEILVSYGDPNDRFAWENAETTCLSPSEEDPLIVALGFLRRLLTGHVELHVSEATVGNPDSILLGRRGRYPGALSTRWNRLALLSVGRTNRTYSVSISPRPERTRQL